MRELIDKKDEVALTEAGKVKEESAKTGAFMRLWPYNQPKILFLFGLIAAAVSGALQPVIGIAFSYILTVLSATDEANAFYAIEDGYVDAYGKATLNSNEYIKLIVNRWSLIMFIGGFVAFLGSIVQKSSFSSLGESATEKIRILLYESILRKNIGWFDHKENGSSVLTSCMA